MGFEFSVLHMSKRYWFTVGSTVWHKKTKQRGEVIAIKGTLKGKDHKAQICWESGLTTWHKNKELTDQCPSGK